MDSRRDRGGPGPVPTWMEIQGLSEESLRAAVTGLGIEILGALCARAEPPTVRGRLCSLSARTFTYTMYVELCRYMESCRAGTGSERTVVPGRGTETRGPGGVVRIKVEDEYLDEGDERDLEDGLCMCNSIRIFEEQRREHHLQVLIDDAVAEVILRGYPVGPELHNLYQDVNGTRKEVRQASSPSMTFSEGVPNEDVAHEDNTRKNWSHTKVNTLIHLYKENKASFENNFTRRKDVWQKIAKKLNKEAGTTFSLEEVDKKWRNLKDRYKRIVVKKRQTGREKSKWQYFDLMDQMLQKDPAINPPHIAQARCSDAMETAVATTLTEVSQEQTVFPVPSTSPPPAPPASSKKRSRSNDDAPQWVTCFMEGAEARHKKARKLLKKVYKEEKRRNELFERFLNMKCSFNNDNIT